MRRWLPMLLVGLLLAGCATRTYRSNTKPVDHFDQDLAACGGQGGREVLFTGVGLAGVILTAAFAAASIIATEVQRDCMAQRGWELSDNPALPPTEPERAVLH